MRGERSAPLGCFIVVWLLVGLSSLPVVGLVAIGCWTNPRAVLLAVLIGPIVGFGLAFLGLTEVHQREYQVDPVTGGRIYLTPWRRVGEIFGYGAVRLAFAGAVVGPILTSLVLGYRTAAPYMPWSRRGEPIIDLAVDSATGAVVTLTSRDMTLWAIGGSAGAPLDTLSLPADGPHAPTGVAFTSLVLADRASSIAAVDSRGTLTVWGPRAGGQSSLQVPGGSPVVAPAFHYDFLHALTADGGLGFFDPSSSAGYRSRSHLYCESGETAIGHKEVACRSSGELAIFDFDGRLQQRWDTSQLRFISGRKSGLRFSPDGSAIAAVSPEGVALVWRLGRPAVRTVSTGAELRGLALSPRGDLLATADDERRVRLWKLESKNSPIDLPGGYRGGRAVLAFDDEGRFVVAGDDRGYITAWDTASAKAVWTNEARR